MIPVYWSILAILAVFLLTNRRYRWFYILWKTLPRDISAGWKFLKLNIRIYQWEKQNETVPKLFSKLVQKHPQKVAFYFEDQKWSFQQIDDLSNQVANFFKSKGYKKGDTVALLLENRPEYVAIWLGLSKISVVTALINTNLLSDPLVHSITVANSKSLIFGSDFSKVPERALNSATFVKFNRTCISYSMEDPNAVNEITPKIQDLEIFEFVTQENSTSSSVNLTSELQQQSNKTPDEIKNTTPRDKLLYIYTSGTTGLPKAAVISNTRYMFIVSGVHFMVDIKEHDIFYNPLPLYHSAGGMAAVGQAILFGTTLVLRRKFSASNYWVECQKYGCTVSNYIGEICRYLLAAHKSGQPPPNHSVKKILGNGMQPQIWKKFVDTFKIDNVYEFYGSTEGNSNLINLDNKIGAVGFVPRYASALYPVTLVRCNEDTGEPVRNENGFCIKCQPNEPGIMIGKINPKRTHQEFTGYADKNATKKKILENVFSKGDLYFNSGDILVQDEFGYVYFKDRTGDTFRWKGENVATSEVENTINSLVELHDCVVYGVEVPGAEGRAGMAALVDPDKKLNLEQFAKGVKANLPAYSVPIFLRILDSVPLTGTFKVKKIELQKEGFDVTKVKDPLYFFDSKKAQYIPLDSEVYNNIISKKLKL